MSDSDTDSNADTNSLVLNSEDFKSLHTEIDIENATTKTGIRGGNRVFRYSDNSSNNPLETQNVDFSEIRDGRLVLDVPKNIGAVGHNITLTFRLIQTNGKIDTIEFHAKLHEISPGTLDRETAIFDVGTKGCAALKKLELVFESEQEKADALFDRIAE